MKKKTIILKKLNVKDIGSNYIKWLNNKKIVKYTVIPKGIKTTTPAMK